MIQWEATSLGKLCEMIKNYEAPLRVRGLCGPPITFMGKLHSAEWNSKKAQLLSNEYLQIICRNEVMSKVYLYLR